MTKRNDDRQLPLFTGAQLRDQAIQRAIDHADDVTEDWSTRAYAMLRRFALERHTFTTEELRAWAHGNGFPLPPEPRAWGGVVQRARQSGLLDWFATETTANPRAHCRRVDRWRSLIHRSAAPPTLR